MIRDIPQARFLAVIPYYVYCFASVALAYIDNDPAQCTPTTYTMITPSPHAEPYAVTKQGQQVTTYIPQYAVCNPDYTDCTTAYETSTYAWCSTRMPCYGRECTITACNQMVTFSHTQSYHLNSVLCASAGNCNVYGTNIYAPSPTIHTYVVPVHTYYAASYLEYSGHENPPITVEECIEVQPGLPMCSEHVEMWEEHYVVHTDVEIIPVTVHTYCPEATKLPHGTEVIHVTGPTTLTFLTEVKRTTLSTESLTSKAPIMKDSCITPVSYTATSTSTSTITEYVTMHSTALAAPTSFAVSCLGDECKPEVQAQLLRPMIDTGEGDCPTYLPEPVGPDHACMGYGCPIPPLKPECAPIVVETPCVTSTTYMTLDYPSTIAPATTAPIVPDLTHYYKAPVVPPPAPIPVSNPGLAPCEGAYCPAPEQKPTSVPQPVDPECKGYDCPVSQPEPGCSGVSCPEHNYHVPVPVVEYPHCEGYDCVEEEGGNSYDSGDLEGYDFEFEDDESIHSGMADVKIDMDGGNVNVTVEVDSEMDIHDIDTVS